MSKTQLILILFALFLQVSMHSVKQTKKNEDHLVGAPIPYMGGSKRFTLFLCRTCESHCGSDEDCLKRCRDKTVQYIIGGVVGGIVLLIIGSGVVFYLKEKGLIGKCMGKLKKRDLGRKFNKVIESISVEEYNKRKDDLLQRFKSKEIVYKIRQNPKISIATPHIIKEQPYLTEIRLDGDDVGLWRGDGFIVCKEKGELLMWFYKEYENRAAHNQVRELAHIVFEGRIKSMEEELTGRWYYLGFEDEINSINNGDWTLKEKGSVAPQPVPQYSNDMAAYGEIQY